LAVLHTAAAIHADPIHKALDLRIDRHVLVGLQLPGQPYLPVQLFGDDSCDCDRGYLCLLLRRWLVGLLRAASNDEPQDDSRESHSGGCADHFVLWTHIITLV